MPAKKHTPEQIIAKLREAEVEIAKGHPVPIAAKKIGVTEQTYYRWRKEYGGLRLDQAKRLDDCMRHLPRGRVPRNPQNCPCSGGGSGGPGGGGIGQL
jgi:hypothetical protein